MDKSIEQNVLKGIGFASKKAGQLIGSIPLAKEGPVDEPLQEGGATLDNLIQIYNHTEVI